MSKRIILVVLALIILGTGLWGGDTAVFVDLGFSPDGRTYMFGQYGIQSGSLRPWADLYVVDVPANNFVPGGKISYTHDMSVVAGQDGSGALYRLLAKNSALADRYNVSYLNQGQPLYISLENGVTTGAETVEFRDFEKGLSFQASLSSSVEGSGSGLRSSFTISLERNSHDGSVRRYVVGNPQIKRPNVASYRIRKVVVAPRDGSLIFVIEMKKQNADGSTDIRYMVEALRL